MSLIVQLFQAHEYHELNARQPSGYFSSIPTTSSSPQEPEAQQSTLTIDKDGEPVLVTELL